MRRIVLLTVLLLLLSTPTAFAFIVQASLGDTVWYDTDADGVFDAGEQGIPGVTVTAERRDSYGNILYKSTRVTDANGFYLFQSLLAGNYHVTTDVTGLQPTYDLDGVVTPNYAFATLAVGQARRDVDFGYVAGRIGDYVWGDVNADGVQDPSESGLPGVQLSLLDSSNMVIATTTTDASGWYEFGGLASGTYSVRVDSLYDGWLIQTYDLDGLMTPDIATGALAAGETRLDFDFGYTKAGSIGDYVWYDADNDAVQDVTESGIPGVKLILRDGGGTQLATTFTNAVGWYEFNGGLPPGTYKVEVDTTTLPPGLMQTYDLDGLATPNIATATLAFAQHRTDVDFGYWEPPETPGLGITKTARVTEINPGESVTYDIVVSNTGGQNIYNIQVKDDAGTPAYAFDDFVVGTIPVLAPLASAVFTVTKAIPVTYEIIDEGIPYTGGWGTAEVLPNGDVRYTYVQSLAVNDNTYGINASPDWPDGHKFSELVGSDKGQFTFTNGAGQVVMKFELDCISASSAFPSGYGCLGLGGDGGMITGSAANLLSYNTSIAQNLNQSPAYYGYTVNSPTLPDPNWNVYNTYTMVVKAAAFGPSGFGTAAMTDQHNSPSKLGEHSYIPIPKDSAVTNTAYVTGVAQDNTPLSAHDSATVWIYTHGRSSIAGNIWVDLAGNGIDDGMDEPFPNVTVSIINAATSAVIATTMTDADGNYVFEELYAGNYRVTVTINSAMGYFTKPTYDRDGIGTPHTALITVGDTDTITDANFGYTWSAAAPYTTWKHDQWGGSSSYPSAGWWLDTYFASVYPGGLVVGTGYSITLTSAAAVDTYLPRTGTSLMLTQNYVNPNASPGGELASQLTALHLNVDYSNAALTKPGLGALHLKTGELMGWTVAQVLAVGEETLGGDRSNLPANVTLTELKDIVKKINENYEKGTNDRGYLIP